MLASGEGTEYWDDNQKVPYYTNGNLWVGYDSIRSISEKVSKMLFIFLYMIIKQHYLDNSDKASNQTVETKCPETN